MLATEIQLLPDKTLFFQLGIFLFVAIALNRFVFKPVLKLIRLRKSRTEGDRLKIEELTEKAEKVMKEYESVIKNAKKEAAQMKEAIHREGEEQGHRIVQEAKQASLVQIDKIKNEIAVASRQAEDQLDTQAKKLGENLAEKILGRPLN